MKIKIKDVAAIHAIDMELLCTFDKMCRDVGLVYSLAGGTLLGAVRHKGFIPWDDDVDLFMLRPDYEKFLKIYNNVILDNPYFRLVHCNNGESGITFARLIDIRASVHHPTSVAIHNVWIDILPLDGIPENEENIKVFVRKLRKLRYLRLLANSRPCKGKSKLRAYIKTPIAYAMRKFGIRKLIIKRIINESQKIPYESSNRVGELVAQARVKGTVCKDSFKDYIWLDFNGKKFMVMPDYENYLKECYGDYMKLPPKKQQNGHKVDLTVDIDLYDGELKEYLLEIYNKCGGNN